MILRYISMIFYKLEPHIADIRLLIRGDTPKELFTSGYKGLYQVLLPAGCEDTDHRIPLPLTRSFHLDSPDTTSLLIDFLSSYLSQCLVDHAIYCRLDIIKLTDRHLDVQLTGHRVKTLREIKGVSYSGAEIVKTPTGQLQTTVIFDI